MPETQEYKGITFTKTKPYTWQGQGYGFQFTIQFPELWSDEWLRFDAIQGKHIGTDIITAECVNEARKILGISQTYAVDATGDCDFFAEGTVKGERVEYTHHRSDDISQIPEWFWRQNDEDVDIETDWRNNPWFEAFGPGSECYDPCEDVFDALDYLIDIIQEENP